jgi:lysozyme
MKINTQLKISDECISLVKTMEGFKDTAYKCPAGIWTIGYGETKGVKQGDTISEFEAAKKLAIRLTEFGESVKEKLTIETSQHQFDALVSFAYNLGVAALSGSTLLKKHNEGLFSEVPTEFLKWNKAKVDGKLTELPGLTRRRKFEAVLYGKA